jgi:hypothetical protein
MARPGHERQKQRSLEKLSHLLNLERTVAFDNEFRGGGSTPAAPP